MFTGEQDKIQTDTYGGIQRMKKFLLYLIRVLFEAIVLGVILALILTKVLHLK